MAILRAVGCHRPGRACGPPAAAAERLGELPAVAGGLTEPLAAAGTPWAPSSATGALLNFFSSSRSCHQNTSAPIHEATAAPIIVPDTPPTTAPPGRRRRRAPSETMRAGFAGRRPGRAGPWPRPAWTHAAHDGDRARQHQRVGGPPEAAEQQLPEPSVAPPAGRLPRPAPAGRARADQDAEQREMPWRATQDPGRLRQVTRPMPRKMTMKGPSACWRPARSRPRPGPA